MPSTESRESPRVRRNRRLAILAVVILAVPVFASFVPTSDAQSGAPLLVVRDISFSRPPAVGAATTVNVLVENEGSGTFVGGTGYLRMFWNVSNYDPNPAPPVGGGSGGSTEEGPSTFLWLNQTGSQDILRQRSSEKELPTMGPGASQTFQFSWIPSERLPESGPQRGTGDIIARIYNGLAAETPYGESVTIRYPRVDLDARWLQTYVQPDDIVSACVTSPAVQDRACRPLPNEILRFRLNVTNRGNVDETFIPSLRDQTQSTEGWKIRFSPAEPRIAAGQTRTLDMFVELPKTGETVEADHTVNPDAEADVVVRVEAESNGKFEETKFPQFRVGEHYELNLTRVQTLKVGNISQTIQSNFTINNKGNSRDQFDMRVDYSKSTIDFNWNVSFNNTFQNGATEGYNRTIKEVEANHFLNQSMSVRPPEYVKKGRYWATVEVRSAGDDVGGPGTLWIQNLSYEVLQSYAIGYEVQGDPSRRALAGEPVEYPITIKNNGNGPDTVTLRLEQRTQERGFDVRLSATRVTVPAFSSEVVTLKVTPPVAEREDRVSHVWVNATSSGPVNVSDTARPKFSAKTDTTVRAGPNIVLDPRTAQEAFVDPNGTRTFEIRVRNLGNRWDNVTFDVQKPPGWEATFQPEKLTLPYHGAGVNEKTVIMTLKAPSDASVGDVANVRVTGVSEVDSTQHPQLAYTARISGPDLYAGAISLSRNPVYAGDLVYLNATVGNRGNKHVSDNVTVQIVYAAGGSERLLVEEKVQGLNAGTTKTVSFPWDTTGLAGAGTIIVKVDEKDGKSAWVEIDETNNVATLGGDFTFVRVFGLKLDSADGLSGRPGVRLRYQESPNAFVLTNDGNKPESVRVAFSSANGWATYTGDAVISIGDGQRIVLPVDVTIPARPGVGEDRITLRIEPVDRPSAALVASATTRIVDNEPPRFADVAITPQDAPIGTKVNVTVTITDAVGIRSATAFIQTPNEISEEIALQYAGGDVWYVDRAWNLAGEHSVYFEAEDLASVPNRNDTRALGTTFTIVPGAAPTIVATTDLSKPIRSGTPVQLDIRDDAGVARAWYVVANSEFSLPRTWALDTSNFTSGVVDLTVHAENVYGVRASERLTLIVDNAPPNVTKMVLEPTRPKAGEEVTLRITTDPKVEAVDVLVKRGGEVVDTVSARNVGPGSFVATYTPVAGEYTFDVVAKDGAGNTRVVEGAVKFGAKSGFLAPGFEVLGALAAIGIALAARRRRG